MLKNEPMASIAYLDIFKVYYSVAGGNHTHKLFNNRKQRIELRVEILARNSAHQQVTLTDEQLLSIRLAEVDSLGNKNRDIDHDIHQDELDGWSTYSDTLGYNYDESAFSLAAAETTEVPFPDRKSPDGSPVQANFEQRPPVTVVHENTPQGAQQISIWVATSKTLDIRLAATFGNFLSSTSTDKSFVILEPKTFNRNAVNISTEETPYPHYSDTERQWNQYIVAKYGSLQTPLAIWYQWMESGIWWDRGDEGSPGDDWFTEFTFSIGLNKGEDLLRDKINEARAEGKLPWRTEHYDIYIFAPEKVHLPKENSCVVVTVLGTKNQHFYWGDGRRTDDKYSSGGDVTDEYGNTYRVTYKYASNGRDFQIVKH
ncbi:hypothetical protein [Enterobacter cloacae]|uniref:hypothetical protein n=1 Tax=Enterobacter cloacae TaxID=550 RepID=UPI00200475F0|nr:hypothetical protein [Enterobacter cloacae]MCK7167211.1 hypothetical protein [Enterobacter cloacae]